MVLKDVVSPDKGKAFMLCNEAIARGAIEADVKVVAFYPGAPTSEILDTFSEALGSFDYQMQIATNEKVALEICAGASFAGFRSLTAMKSVGMNVASDTLFVLGYTGVGGGMVIVMADDPHAHSSQSEQDGRFFAPNAYIPMLEPSTAQESKDMVKEAFAISERHRVPVIVRTVTRVRRWTGKVAVIDALAIAKECGNPNVENAVFLGCLSALRDLPLDPEKVKEAIAEVVPRGTVEQNLKAFESGIRKASEALCGYGICRA
ncbi:MAG: 2-oxoacid:acceptor oxidoreductase family protein [Candidatus Methanosuratincola sp.]|jgi:indolepyruvate ferredoxin oxidoreductase alpha subunit|nr:2-oxoacid:acceptor oxidoreductase family protein [Candidatus Methanosuratincola sp.]